MNDASTKHPPASPVGTGESAAPMTVGYDVTELCRLAASVLGPNEMIHDPDFSLYSAMSALELMDAKMDKPPPVLESLESRIASGTLPLNLDDLAPAPASSPSKTKRSPSAADSAASTGTNSSRDNSDPSLIAKPCCSAFSPSQRALSVLDGMSVCEVAWHEGGSLPETLYACLYLHPVVFSAVLSGLGWVAPAPNSSAFPRQDLQIKEGKFSWKPVDRALTLAILAQALATLRCCSLARDVIILADIFEEEDFYPSTFGFRLAPPVEDDSLMDLLSLAEGAMRERIQKSGDGKTSAEEGGKAGDKKANRSRRGSSGPDECILAHLESRKQLLHAYLALRDAFTNKQRLRRLNALAKRRAEEQASNGADNSSPDNRIPLEAGVGAPAPAAATGMTNTASLATAGVSAGGQTNGDGRSQEGAETAGEVGAVTDGVASMSIDRPSAVAVDDDGAAVGGTRGEACQGNGNGDSGGLLNTERQGAVVAGAAGKKQGATEDGGGSDVAELVVEGRAVATTGAGTSTSGAAAATPPVSAAPGAGGVLGRAEEEGNEQQQQQQALPEDACDGEEDETPLGGIWRCEGHLRAAAATLESLLAIEASLEHKPEKPQPPPPPLAPASPSTTDTGARSRSAVGDVGSTAAAAAAVEVAVAGRGAARVPEAVVEAGAVRGAVDGKQEFSLGGEAGTFAFEAEMNRHLLGSSPQHHVHFRRGRADGPRTMMLLARQAERACRVVRCDDLLDVRRCLLRLFQPAEESESEESATIGTASLFARSIAAVCLYRNGMVLGRFDLMWFVAEAMTDVGVPDAVVNSPSGMALLERVGKPVYETLRTLCLNRARQRTSLELQMQDWRTLQAYADTVDDAFQLQYGLASSTQRYMSKWALTEVLGLMHRYLQTGVELQLPSTHEWSGTYWYWDYVMTTKMITEGSLREAKEQLEAVKAQMEEERAMAKEAEEAAEAAAAAAAEAAAAAATAAAAQPSSVGGGGGKKSKKKKRGGSKNKKPDTALPPGGQGGGTGASAGPGLEKGGNADGEGKRPVASPCSSKSKEAPPAFGIQRMEREMRWAARRDWESTDMKVRQCLCRGAVRLIAGLESLGVMGKKAGELPEFRFTTPAIVHRERFKAFQALDVPGFQSHQAFLEAVDFDDEEAPKVVEASVEFFRVARTLALDLLRRGDAEAKEASVVPGASPDAATCVADGRANGSNPPPIAPAGAGLGVVDPVGGGWAADRLELLAMAKLAVANGVTAMQVTKRCSGGGSPGASKTAAAAAGKKGVAELKGRARLDFGLHNQFPVVKATFE